MAGQQTRQRTYVVVHVRAGHIAVTRVGAPRIDAAMVTILSKRAIASRIEYLGNGVSRYVNRTGDAPNTDNVYYVADVEAMQVKA